MKLPRFANLRPRERVLAAGCTVILLMVALDRLVLTPWVRHGRKVRQEIQEMEKALQNHARLLTRQAQVSAEFERYQRYLQPAIADELQTAALLKEIEELAGESHVKLVELKSLGVETEDTFKRYTFEARFQCVLDEWIEFVYRVESSPSLYEVVRAGLSVPEERPERLDGTLRIMSVAMNSGVAGASTDSGGAHVASAR